MTSWMEKQHAFDVNFEVNALSVPKEDLDPETYSRIPKFTYKGEFLYKRPTDKDRVAIGVELAKLTKGEYDKMDKDSKHFSYAMAYLSVTLIESPDWWKSARNGQDLEHTEIIWHLFDIVMAWEMECIQNALAPVEPDGK